MTNNLFIETAIEGVDCALEIEITTAKAQDYWTLRDVVEIESAEVTSADNVTITEAQKWADANHEKISKKFKLQID